MLFNSYTFIFIFLPLALLLFHGLRRTAFERGSILVLTLMSLVFYGWWNARYLLLLVPLMFANFAVATRIAPRGGQRPAAAKPLLMFGLAFNLAALGYFKYANFFLDNVNSLLGLDLFLEKIVLPIGISFFIFQKIAFLVDAYDGKVERFNLLDYSLFVAFFPQLIAGPIVHHSEVMPQFRKAGSVPADYFALGITIFMIGLAKKVLFADTAASYASPQFAALATGAKLDLFAYTAQLYFDFSGYSDMAIGGALLFGIRLPVNFNSPYKSASIIEFWRRWHISLSRFLRDYLYIPLGGNRKGRARRYVNLLITMLLGGIWHGAGWTFAIWGALHGLYLTINQAWRMLNEKLGFPSEPSNGLGRRIGQVTTFLAVVVAWVFFRSENVSSAVEMLKAMAGIDLTHVPYKGTAPALTDLLGGQVTLMFTSMATVLPHVFLVIAWTAPNTQQLTAYVGPTGVYSSDDETETEKAGLWKFSPAWAVAVGCLFGVTLLFMTKVSEFIYFQF